MLTNRENSVVEERDSYLHWDSFGNVHYQLYVGIVVIVGATGHGNVMICHFYVFCKEQQVSVYSVEDF